MVYIYSGSARLLEGARVYIHLKGYSYARVTHLDIEHGELDGLIEGDGGYFRLRGVTHGILIYLDSRRRILVRHRGLNRVLREGESTVTWVGAKEGGIYIGFQRKYIPRLEDLARMSSGTKYW